MMFASGVSVGICWRSIRLYGPLRGLRAWNRPTTMSEFAETAAESLEVCSGCSRSSSVSKTDKGRRWAKHLRPRAANSLAGVCPVRRVLVHVAGEVVRVWIGMRAVECRFAVWGMMCGTIGERTLRVGCGAYAEAVHFASRTPSRTEIRCHEAGAEVDLAAM